MAVSGYPNQAMSVDVVEEKLIRVIARNDDDAQPGEWALAVKEAGGQVVQLKVKILIPPPDPSADLKLSKSRLELQLLKDKPAQAIVKIKNGKMVAGEWSKAVKLSVERLDAQRLRVSAAGDTPIGDWVITLSGGKSEKVKLIVSVRDDKFEFKKNDPAVKEDPALIELIRNGDFEQGNKEFRSDYVFSRGNVWDPTTYDVAGNPSDVHKFGAYFPDHTSGKGLMMVVNTSSNAAKKLVWGQTAAVRPGVDYTFKLSLAGWTAKAGAEIDIRINGQSIGKVVPGVAGDWTTIRIPWNSGTATSAAIDIFNLKGNSFALDDISLRGPPAP